MRQLERPDQIRVEAVQGWIGLGDLGAAASELEQVSWDVHRHPVVLAARVLFYEADGRWNCAADLAEEVCRLDPQNVFGWVHHARALQVLRRPKEAWRRLLAVADRFPKDSTLAYQLARLACQLGDCTGAWWWMEKALKTGFTDEVRRMALKEEDLKRLWPKIAAFEFQGH